MSKNTRRGTPPPSILRQGSASLLGARRGYFPDFSLIFFRWFLGTAPGTLFGGFWVDFGRFFGAIWVPFWRSLDFVILQPLSRQTIDFGVGGGHFRHLFGVFFGPRFRTSFSEVFCRFSDPRDLHFGVPGPAFPAPLFQCIFAAYFGPDWGGFGVDPLVREI